jgi:hypothetical protein
MLASNPLVTGTGHQGMAAMHGAMYMHLICSHNLPYSCMQPYQQTILAPTKAWFGSNRKKHMEKNLSHPGLGGQTRVCVKCVLRSSSTLMMTHDTETNVTLLIYNRVPYKIDTLLHHTKITLQQPKLTRRRQPRPLTNSSQHPSCASSCGTCS